MGSLRKAGRAIGYEDKDLIRRGLLARGRVTECRRTSLATGTGVQSVVCNLTVEVELDDRPLYSASCKHAIQVPYLPQFESGEGYVAVRVDPGDPSNIELDLTHPVPPSRAGAAAGEDATPPNRESALSAAQILATGTPCRAIVQSVQPLGFQKDGRDVWGVVLNVLADGAPASQARIGVGVPAAAMALLFPGADLPARRRADIDDGVSIDWDAALAEKA